MKFPNHILLDISKHFISDSVQYWIFKYLFAIEKNLKLFENLTLHRYFFLNKEKLFLNNIMENQKKFTIKYIFSNPAIFLSEKEKKFYKNVFQPRLKVKHRVLDSNHFGKQIYDYLLNPKAIYDEKSLRRLFKQFSYKTNTFLYRTDNLWNLFDVNFIKKEKIYTKLKYSKVPQYDIVSGGAALLLGGFLAFLICEKFGFEMVDSGDFYFLFIYIVFLIFSCRPFFKIMTKDKLSWNFVSFKWLIYFSQILLYLVIKFIKLFTKKYYSNAR